MRPVATGMSTITATVGAVSGSATLTVLPPPVTQQGGISVNGTSGYDAHLSACLEFSSIHNWRISVEV